MRTFLLGICLFAISNLALAQQQTWYFVRHFEKQSGDNPSLTEAGKARAKTLAAFFSDKLLSYVYSTNFNRTIETATPVATLKNLAIQSYDPRNLEAFTTELKTLNHVLVVGHSNTTPELLGLMGGANIIIEETEYGTIYELKSKNSVLSSREFTISSN